MCRTVPVIEPQLKKNEKATRLTAFFDVLASVAVTIVLRNALYKDDN
ncbi:MAG: hypothetical protein OEM48_04655 [Gammaproteobacteria bacterium]|nr:hypothetical protein [Gammaproteobacteria bacterium]MDH3370314.1 hypothetical protein [Gammaproteobacteria bacterium]MDH3406210.1 hypothetical protein [Gammaproteobacteria bacterium]MDH3562976.1 hypothetical protein [Gammaproteobacteria bacterium]